MSYGTPRAFLANSEIFCPVCIMKRYGSELEETDMGFYIESAYAKFIYLCDNELMRDTEDTPITVVREGQNQDFLVDTFCGDCGKDIEATCTDY